MVGENVNDITSIDELEKVIEKNRQAAALIAKATLEKDVIHVVAQIDKTCEISVARIISESEISIARISANAEIASVRFSSQSELIESEIKKLQESEIDEKVLPLP